MWSDLGNFLCSHMDDDVQGVPKKIARSLCTTILQPYVTGSCGFQQNVQKEIIYTIEACVWIWQLDILCFAAGKWAI